MQNITDVDAFTDPGVAIADGDALNGTNFLTMMQWVANRTRWIKNRMLGVTAGDVLAIPLNIGYNLSARFSRTAAPMQVRQTDTTSAGAVSFEITPPCSCQLNSVTVIIKPAGAHGGLPGTMPTLSVWRWDPTTETNTQLGSTTTDTSASVGVYEGAHTLTVSGLTETIDTETGTRFYALFTGESGANAVNNLNVNQCRATVSPV